MIVSYSKKKTQRGKLFLILLDDVRSLYILQTEYILYSSNIYIHIFKYIL